MDLYGWKWSHPSKIIPAFTGTFIIVNQTYLTFKGKSANNTEIPNFLPFLK